MMADDTVRLMDLLRIEKAHIMGVSMGGMIAQELAINYPERVMKLVLACTYASQDETSGDTLEQAKFLQLTPEKKVSAMVGLAFNSHFTDSPLPSSPGFRPSSCELQVR
jgi:pimeloyl-ACP methyl ester carboxylesterase